MEYFTKCRTAEELKKEYKKVAKQLHPDCGGNEEEFKRMQREFSVMWDRLKNVHINRDGERYTKETEETAAEYMETIARLMRMDGIAMELCGSWLWITGNTKQHKAELKAMGARWSRNKACWYIHNEPYRKYRKKVYSLDEIRDMYGSRKFQKEQDEFVQKKIDVR